MFARRLGTEAAALAYYTIFSIVPVLVTVLWALKLLHADPRISTPADGDVSVLADAKADARSADANVLLREAVRGVLAAVERAGTLQAGLVGLAALIYGVIRLVIHVESALDTIAGARERPARYRRMLGYLALLALPPALLVVSGVLRMLGAAAAGRERGGLGLVAAGQDPAGQVDARRRHRAWSAVPGARDLLHVGGPRAHRLPIGGRRAGR